ncbi:MAG: recombinase family protein [Deltaproteobacteria bacterium]|nr:recombinase family protein [Deltaproteobacteria bacterium]
MTKSVRAVGYLRVSTDKQADRGVSLDVQRAKVEAYASLYDLDLVEVIVDAGASAKTLDRPGLQRALGMVKSKKVDALLVLKLDRLTRSVVDLGTLVADYFSKENGPALLSVSDQIDTRTSSGRLVLNVLMSVSQWEREAIGERTSSAMQHMRSENKYTGGRAPYGWQLVAGELVRHEAEQLVLEAARAMRASGLALRAVAVELAARGFVSRTGETFTASAIRNMVA